jgi:hypothetical protein
MQTSNDETLMRTKQPIVAPKVGKDDKQPRDSGKPLLEKQPGSSPQVRQRRPAAA